ncbi:MAG: shikimate dehydrogenase [Alphaproteobacteria bacterium]|nr:MAG: shikimate dehydrogenase [Alphaproteobacteria bacterium]
MTQQTKIAGVCGWPISHSLSPRLHGFWIKRHNLDADYRAWPVEPKTLRTSLNRLRHECATENGIFRGTNLTIPLKEEAMGIMDILHPTAKRIGAVNTVVVQEDGQLLGRNTDAEGFTNSLAEHADITKLKGGSALLLGAGGAARALVTALQDMGLSRIQIANRTTDRAEKLAQEMGGAAEVLPWDQREAALAETDILINSTSLGMAGQPALDLSLDRLREKAIVSDIVYVPLETELLKAARLRGNIAVDGLGMLLYQARAGFTAWFGQEVAVDQALRDHVLEALQKK